MNVFNLSPRFVQLNVVALGLNELGDPPLLTSERWRLVRNPFVLSEAARELEKARRFFEKRYGSSLHGFSWRLRSRLLAIKEWGLCDEKSDASPSSTQPEAHTYFMSQLPHPDYSRPMAMRTLRSGSVLSYFEHPRTIGEIVAGTKPRPIHDDQGQCGQTNKVLSVNILLRIGRLLKVSGIRPLRYNPASEVTSRRHQSSSSATSLALALRRNHVTLSRCQMIDVSERIIAP